MDREREQIWQWLCMCPDITADEITALVHYFRGPENIFSARPRDLAPFASRGLKWAKNLQTQMENMDLLQAQKKLDDLSLRFVSRENQAFPARLRNIPDCPWGLFFRGELPRPDRPAVAVIGARKCSPYGEEMAMKIGRELAEAGYIVISGMAAGIDGIAQEGCLDAGGDSCAVLGCGAERYYPPENGALYRKLCSRKGSGVLSEYGPGTPPLGRNFPLRNRIISGLSDAVIVVEARQRSGSLITADIALEQGKDVYAVPGRYNDLLSCGCNHLIEQGAGIVASTDSLIENLAISCELKRVRVREEPFQTVEVPDETDEPAIRRRVREDGMREKAGRLPEAQQKVLAALSSEPSGIDDLLPKTGLELPVLLQSIVSLQVQQLVAEVSKNRYVSRVMI